MPHAGLQVVRLEVGPDVGAQVLRRHGLADGADVVALALHREQRGAADGLGPHGAAGHGERAARQVVGLEHAVHRLQVELGRQVVDGQVLVVEGQDGLGLLGFAIDQVLVQVAELRLVALQVHAHEGAELHEAGVHAAPRAAVRPGHVADQVALEPADGPIGGQRVDLRGVDAAVHRAGHQGQAARRGGVVVLGHQRGGGQCRHAGLAHGHQVRAGAHGAQEGDDLQGVVVQPEAAAAQRHVARVVPVGDVHVVVAQQRAHGVAQQGGEVARQRRGQQHPRLRRAARGHQPPEVQQRAERRHQRGLLHHRHRLAVHAHVGDAVVGPAVRDSQARHHLQRGRRVRQRAARAGTGQRRPHEPGGHARGGGQIGLRLIHLIEHAETLQFAGQRPRHVPGMGLAAGWFFPGADPWPHAAPPPPPS